MSFLAPQEEMVLKSIIGERLRITENVNLSGLPLEHVTLLAVVCKFLEVNALRVLKLNMSRCGLTNSDLRPVLSAGKKGGMSNMIELRLSGNIIGLHGIEALAKCLDSGAMPYISTLELEDIAMCGLFRDIHGYLEGTYDPDGAVTLFKAIQKRKIPITDLNISNNVLCGRLFVDEQGDFAVVEALSMLPQGLKKLYIGNNSLGCKGSAALQKAIGQFQELQVLDLSSNALCDLWKGRTTRTRGKYNASGFAELCRSISVLPLRKLNMSHNLLCGKEGTWGEIKTSGLDALMKSLPYQDIEELDLRDNGMYGNGAQVVGDALLRHTFPSLTSLNMGGNMMCWGQDFGDYKEMGEGDLALVQFSRVLTKVGVLTKLDLSGNSIHPSGAKALAEALLSDNLSRIEDFDLGDNLLGPGGMHELTECMLKGGLSRIKRLNLNGNALWEEGMEHLEAAAKRGKTKLLESLQLADNALKAGGAVSLAEAVGCFPKLKSLHIKNNSFGDEGASVVVDALVQAQSSLDQTLLEFSVNQLGILGGNKMAEYLDFNDKIEKLDVHKHVIPVKVVRAGHAPDELSRYISDIAEKAVIQQLKDEAVNPAKLLRNLRPFEEKEFVTMWEDSPDALEEALFVAVNKMLGSGDERDLSEDLQYLQEYVFPLPAFASDEQFDQLQAVAQAHLAEIKVLMDEHYDSFVKGEGGDTMSILTDFTSLNPLRQDHPQVACIDPEFIKASKMTQSETEREDFDYMVEMDKNCFASMLAAKAAVLDVDFIEEVHAALKECKIRPVISHAPRKTFKECHQRVAQYMKEDYNVYNSRPWPRACEIVDAMTVMLTCDGGTDIANTIALLEAHPNFEIVSLKNSFHHNSEAEDDGFRDVRLTICMSARGQKMLCELRIQDAGFLRLQRRMEKPQLILSANSIETLLSEPDSGADHNDNDDVSEEETA